ncbi:MULTISPECIES: hypothetical protein [Bradyrhizobium]|uniref:hypothetical protein n=1 Tax=Bradyrhizobium TaxID=374 RepID=UPI0023063A19|nr:MULTISPECIES: hypothetical protein [Bradyrhizobium]WLA76034.1 hypothetical protein QIH77_12845 [Bradyrhizobium diazoefficiens]
MASSRHRDLLAGTAARLVGSHGQFTLDRRPHGIHGRLAQALAVLCTSALQGALIQARVERSGRPIEVTAAELAREAVKARPRAPARRA